MKKVLLKTVLFGFLLLVVMIIISAIYNLTLPVKSGTTEKLTLEQKTFILETMNLIQYPGKEVWPGWEGNKIPFIVYNEKHAFLINYEDPPAGWMKMPREELRGLEWEVVDSDDFFGKPYYRQFLTNPDVTPENFTVKVGTRWVPTMETQEYAAISFYKGFKNELPPILKSIFPYRIFWELLMGKVENYIGGLVHEAFHALQGSEAPNRLAESEWATPLSSYYLWNDTINETGWRDEANLLIEAFNSENDENAVQLVEQFLKKRNERRKNINMSDEIIKYEQKREWLEGLAKYAELTIGVEAYKNQSYRPVNGLEKIHRFENYKASPDYLKRQILEVKRAVNRPGENRFYYTGMIQALILDRIYPGWKKEAFEDNIYLDDLLEMAINKSIDN